MRADPVQGLAGTLLADLEPRDPRITWFDVGEGGASEAIDRIRAHLEAA